MDKFKKLVSFLFFFICHSHSMVNSILARIFVSILGLLSLTHLDSSLTQFSVSFFLFCSNQKNKRSVAVRTWDLIKIYRFDPEWITIPQVINVSIPILYTQCRGRLARIRLALIGKSFVDTCITISLM